MKQIIRLAFLLGLSLASLQIWADTCPRIEEINSGLPPSNWEFLISPELPTNQYQFSSAIHSLNSIFYYEHVICRYDACPSYLCPAFTLISFKIYQEPSENRPPWNH